MTIFARRVIQRMLDENRAFVPAAAVAEHVKKLNKGDRESLGTEWEVLVLNVLHKIGSVDYEREWRGPKKPDVFFESNRIPHFVADIRTVSDRSYEDDNPVDYFYDCIKSYFAKRGRRASGINVQVDGEVIGEYRDQKIKLHLPPKGIIPTFVKKYFAPVVESIKSHPRKPFTMTIGEGKHQVRLSYDPDKQSFSGGHLSPCTPLSLKRNPIHNCLKKKSEQLRGSGYAGVKGVFICDGACEALHASKSWGSAFSREAIIRAALKDNSTVSFVVVLSVVEKHERFTWKSKRSVALEFFSNQHANYVVGRRFWAGLSLISKHIPIPVATPRNALYSLEAGVHEGISFFGGFSMSDDGIRIPSRMLTEILGGTCDYNRIAATDRGITQMRNYFRSQIAAGKTISEISVVKSSEEDDDWIRIEYAPDPAISRFK